MDSPFEVITPGQDIDRSDHQERQENSEADAKRRQKAIPPGNVSRCQLMSVFGEKLGRKKEAGILALLTSRNIEEAARVAGVNPRTLYRWQKEPEFAAAYREGCRAAVSQANARIQQASGAATTTILKLMLDPTVPASVRIRASECVLTHANKTIEIEDVEARVAALEEAAQGTGPKTIKTISSRRLRKGEKFNEVKLHGFLVTPSPRT